MATKQQAQNKIKQVKATVAKAKQKGGGSKPPPSKPKQSGGGGSKKGGSSQGSKGKPSLPKLIKSKPKPMTPDVVGGKPGQSKPSKSDYGGKPDKKPYDTVTYKKQKQEALTQYSFPVKHPAPSPISKDSYKGTTGKPKKPPEYGEVQAEAIKPKPKSWLASALTHQAPNPFEEVPGGGKLWTGWDEVKDVANRRWDLAEKKTQQAGKGEYKNWYNVFHNLGQVPYLGNVATSLGQSVGLLGLPAEMVEVGVGNLAYKKLEQQLGPKTGIEQKAYQQALSQAGYSGANAVIRTYRDLLNEYRNQGIDPSKKQPKDKEIPSLGQEKIAEIGGKNSIWWRELGGQLVLDPLNLLSAPGKAAAQSGKIAKGAKLYTQVWKGADNLPVAVEKVEQALKLAASKGAQVENAESLLGRVAARLNPRFKSTVKTLTNERLEQAAQFAYDAAHRLGLQDAKKLAAVGSPEYAKALEVARAKRLQDISELWVRTASKNPQEVEDALKALRSVGLGNIPASPVGRQMGVVLRDIMTNGKGELTDITHLITEGKKIGMKGDQFVAALGAKMDGVLDNLIETPKFERDALVRIPQQHLKWRQPIDSMFARMYMGMSFGFPARNMYDNFVKMVSNGWSPFSLVKHAKGPQTPVRIVGAQRGIVGTAMDLQEGEKLGLFSFGSWLGQKGEKFVGQAIAGEAYLDAQRRLVPAVVKHLESVIPPGTDPRVAGLVRARLRNAIPEGPDALNKVLADVKDLMSGGVGSDVARASGDASTSASRLLEEWRTPHPKIMDAIENTGDNLGQEVRKILEDAGDPGEAVQQVRKLQQKYAEKIAEAAREVPNVGPVEGTLSGEAARQMLMSEEISIETVRDLATYLSVVETELKRSRGLAYAAALDSVRPGEWANLLNDVEMDYNAALNALRRRQIKGYGMLVSGQITEKQYVDTVRNAYNAARNTLDKRYGQVINEAGLGAERMLDVANKAEELPRILRQQLVREAYEGGIESAVDKTDDIQDVADQWYSYWRSPSRSSIPAKHFQNIVNQAVGRKVKNITELNQDELVVAINRFLERRGRNPITADQIWEDALARSKPSYLGQLSPNELPFEAVPMELSQINKLAAEEVAKRAKWGQGGEEFSYIYDEMGRPVYTGLKSENVQSKAAYLKQLKKDVEDLLKTGNEDAMQAAAAMYRIATDSAPVLSRGADIADAAFYGGQAGIKALDDLAQVIAATAKNPPMPMVKTATDHIPGWEKFFEAAIGAQSEMMITAAEVAKRSRDFALLNYQDRRYFDPLIKSFFPWAYWHTRSIPNWSRALMNNPKMMSWYANYRNQMREANMGDPNIPEWHKESLVLNNPLGYEGNIAFSLEAMVNPIAQMFESFEDPQSEKDAYGSFVTALGNLGVAPHPLFGMVYAAERAFLHGDADGARSLGYLAPITRALAATTGTVLEPWLWLRDPKTGERIPWTGGDQWEQAKATKRLAWLQKYGAETGIRPEEAFLGGATRFGDAYGRGLNEVLSQRQIPVLGSFLFGIKLGTMSDWEGELFDDAATFFKIDPENKLARKGLLIEKPWLSTYWMSKPNEANRIAMLYKGLQGRLPPGTTQAAQDMFDQVGLDKYIREGFDWNLPDGGIVEWEPDDYDQFVKGTLRIAELLKYPDIATGKEWLQAKTDNEKLWAEYNEKFPKAEEQGKVYWAMRNAGDEEAANAYARKVGLFDAWNWRDTEMVENDLLIKYYAEPSDIDSATKALVREQANARWPGIFDVESGYFQIDPEDKSARRQYRIQHPELAQYWDWKGGAEDAMQTQLLDERAKAGMGAQIMYTDYIIKGKPSAAQRAALETIRENNITQAIRPPLPVKDPETLTPVEKARIRASDAAYAAADKKYPGAYAAEKVYEQIKLKHGEDSAKLYAKEHGLFDYWSEVKAQKIKNPILLAEMTDEQLEGAASSKMRQQAEVIFPGIGAIQDEYYQWPRKSDQRKKILSDNPILREYWNWKDNAEKSIYEQLINERNKAKQAGYRELPTMPVKPGGKVSQVLQTPEEKLDSIIDAISAVESGGSYTAQSKQSSASGKYQYIDSTWGGYGGYARAYLAPPEVQDERMKQDIAARLTRYGGDVEKVFAAHYYPKWANNKELWDQRPTPDQITVRQYVDKMLSKMK